MQQLNIVTSWRNLGLGGKPQKEAHFFTNGAWRSRRKYGLAFAEAPIKFEFTPGYIYWRKVPNRVKVVCPGAKFLVVYRNPVDRVFSAYRLARSRRDLLPLAKIVEVELKDNEQYFDRLLADGAEWESPAGFQPVRTGLYVAQLWRWLTVFSAKQFIIIEAEWMFGHQEETVKEVLKFMGQDVEQRVVPQHLNRGDKVEVEGEEELIRVLGKFYAPWQEKLTKMLAGMEKDGAVVLPRRGEGDGVLLEPRGEGKGAGSSGGLESPVVDSTGEDRT